MPQECGGVWSSSVYTTGVVPAAADSMVYLGCYHDKPVRALPNQLPTSSEMTVQMCVNSCADADYAFAGLQVSTECYCGDVYDQYGAADATSCDINCVDSKVRRLLDCCIRNCME